jgi:cysteinyl-tRNA synthetase
MLDDDTFVLGVDEHTGLVIDLDTQIATVVGNGTVTVRLRGQSHVYATGATLSLEYLQNPWTQNADAPQAPQRPIVTLDDVDPQALSLAADTDKAIAEFDLAIAGADAPGAVRAALTLESCIRSWSADTLQSDSADRAHAVLRSMISRLGDAATTGLQDPRQVLAPFVDALITVRTIVRAEKRYDLSDIIRDIFAAQGIEVRDTPDGVEWDLHVM